MNSKITGRKLCAALAVLGLTCTMGCGKKEAAAPPATPGGVGVGLESRLNDPNIPPDIKEKMKASAQPTGGAAPAAGGTR